MPTYTHAQGGAAAVPLLDGAAQAKQDAGQDSASPTLVQRQPTDPRRRPAPPGLTAAELMRPLPPAGAGREPAESVREWLRRNRGSFVLSTPAQVVAAVRQALPRESSSLDDGAIIAIARQLHFVFRRGLAPPAPARPPLSESGPQADTPAPDAGVEPNMATTVARAVASYRDVNRALQNAASEAPAPAAVRGAAREGLRGMEQRGTGESLTRQPPEEEKRDEE